MDKPDQALQGVIKCNVDMTQIDSILKEAQSDGNHGRSSMDKIKHDLDIFTETLQKRCESALNNSKRECGTKISMSTSNQDGGVCSEQVSSFDFSRLNVNTQLDTLPHPICPIKWAIMQNKEETQSRQDKERPGDSFMRLLTVIDQRTKSRSIQNPQYANTVECPQERTVRFDFEYDATPLSPKYGFETLKLRKRVDCGTVSEQDCATQPLDTRVQCEKTLRSELSAKENLCLLQRAEKVLTEFAHENNELAMAMTNLRAQATTEIAKVSNQRDNALQEIEDLKRENDTLTESQTQMNELLDQLRIEMNDAAQKLRQEMNTTQQKYEATEEKLNSDIAQLEDKLKQKEEAAQHDTESIDRLREENGRLLAESTGGDTAYRLQIKQLKKERDKAQTKITAMEGEVRQLMGNQMRLLEHLEGQISRQDCEEEIQRQQQQLPAPIKRSKKLLNNVQRTMMINQCNVASTNRFSNDLEQLKATMDDRVRSVLQQKETGSRLSDCCGIFSRKRACTEPNPATADQSHRDCISSSNGQIGDGRFQLRLNQVAEKSNPSHLSSISTNQPSVNFINTLADTRAMRPTQQLLEAARAMYTCNIDRSEITAEQSDRLIQEGRDNAHGFINKLEGEIYPDDQHLSPFRAHSMFNNPNQNVQAETYELLDEIRIEMNDAAQKLRSNMDTTQQKYKAMEEKYKAIQKRGYLSTSSTATESSRTKSSELSRLSAVTDFNRHTPSWLSSARQSAKIKQDTSPWPSSKQSSTESKEDTSSWSSSKQSSVKVQGLLSPPSKFVYVI